MLSFSSLDNKRDFTVKTNSCGITCSCRKIFSTWAIYHSAVLDRAKTVIEQVVTRILRAYGCSMDINQIYRCIAMESWFPNGLFPELLPKTR